MKIFVTGVSGTGKTSIVRELIERGIAAFDMDDLCHWEHKHTGKRAQWGVGQDEAWHDSHVWLCDIPALKKELEKADTVVIAGHASNQDDFFNLFNKFFVLRSTPETLVTRIMQREDNDWGKHPNEQRRILRWQKAYDPEMVAKGAIPIDVERPLKSVVEEIMSFLR